MKFLPSRRLLIGTIGALIAVSSIGRALMPTLIATEPLALIVLSPIPAHLLLVAPVSHPAAFIAVTSLRRGFSALCGYYLGVHFGQAAIDWVDKRSGLAGRGLRLLQRGFERFPYPTIALVPNLGTPLLAGVARLPVGAYLAADLVGQAIWAAGFYFAGDALRDVILPIIEFLREHVFSITAVTIALVLIIHLVRRRRRAGQPQPEPFDDLL